MIREMVAPRANWREDCEEIGFSYVVIGADFACPRAGLSGGATRVVSVYVPNGQSVGSDKYAYKLRWLEALREWLRGELERHPRMAVLGDFNIAPEPRDVHDPLAWEGRVLFSEPEREALRALVGLGFADEAAQPPRAC